MLDVIFSICATLVALYWLYNLESNLENLNLRLKLMRKAMQEMQQQLDKLENKNEK
jgi:hypothetical protein